MPTGLLKDIAGEAPRNVALLGLDVGAKTIGLAVSDPGQRVATPLRTIKRTKFTKDILLLGEVIREFEIGGFVLGLPVSMDGSEGRRAQSIRDFAQEMNNHPKIFGADPFIAFWDERLSTVSVEEFVDKSVGKRKTKANAKSSGLIDKLAAQIILQGALDFLTKKS
ncbi:MAG: Holliday junction resolvase RuvX [Alphaproteobacteria bacterium]|nr:Holliday junction resolvase RuvX [Alphaproteobacteria bacterium]